MVQSLARAWVVALLVIVVLVVTLIQPTRAEATDVDTALGLEPLDAPAVALVEPEVPDGVLEAPDEMVMETESTPVEISPSDQGSDSDIDMDSLTVVERTEFSAVYESAEGSTVERLSMDPLNVEVDDEWVAIETDIQSSGDGWAVEAHPLAPEFADDANAAAPVTLSRGGHEVSFSLLGAGAGAAQAPFWWWDDWDTITYADVTPGVDLAYEVTEGTVKETVVLHEEPAEGEGSWSWRIRPGSLTPELLEDGSLVMVNPVGDVVMAVPTPIAWDSSDTNEQWRSEIVLDAALEQTGASFWRYTLTADEDWLQDDDRVYPVYIDPTFVPGVNSRLSFKSDGATQSGLLNTGNPNQAGSTVFWRSIASFDYGSIPGRFIHTAQIGVGLHIGQTAYQSGHISHACDYSYACSGTPVTDYALGTGWTETGGGGPSRNTSRAGLPLEIGRRSCSERRSKQASTRTSASKPTCGSSTTTSRPSRSPRRPPVLAAMG